MNIKLPIQNLTAQFSRLSVIIENSDKLNEKPLLKY